MNIQRLGVAVGALLALTACQTIVEELLGSSDSNPQNAPAARPSPVTIVIPAPSTAPAPTPSPSSQPEVAPPTEPEPEPDASEPLAGSCHIPAGNGSGVNCPRQSPSFQADLDSSMDALLREQPDLFRRDGCATCYRVLDVDGFIEGLMGQLNRRGLCSYWDGGEMAIKSNNQFSDQYAIMSSSHFMRRGEKVYRATCHPAWF